MKPDLIICSDLHLREDDPECWLTSYWDVQEQNLKILRDLEKEHKCSVIIAGDIFDHWKSSHFLVSYAFDHLPKSCYVVAGQHDLKYNNFDQLYQGALGILVKAGRVKLLHPGPENVVSPYGMLGYSWEIPYDNEEALIYVFHKMTWMEQPYPGANKGQAETFLDKFDHPCLIITGDNHQHFILRKEGKIILNPGKFMIQRSSEMEEPPFAFLWSHEDHLKIEKVKLVSGQTAAVSKLIVKDRDERISSYVDVLKDVGNKKDKTLLFSDILDELIQESGVPPTIVKLIRRAQEGTQK